MQHISVYKYVILFYGHFVLSCASLSDESNWLDDTTDFSSSTSAFYLMPGYNPEGPNMSSVVPTVSADLLQASNALVELYQTNVMYRDLMSNITELCPGWMPCNVLREPEPGTECCLTCFCDENCGITRPCCPGFKSNKTELKGVLEFEDVPKICVESAYFTENEREKYFTPDFEMIANCPDDTPELLKDKCVALFNEKEAGYIHAFVDILPVTHTESLTNFANKHCAACHGLSRDQYRNWGARVICLREISYDSGDFEAEVQLFDNCYLKIIPPSFIIGNITQCIKEMRSQCNITGLWEAYDPKIETLCEDVDWFYRTPRIVGQTNENILDGERYKNIFCAICNGDTYNVEGYTGICPGTGFDGVVTAFTFLVNHDAAFQDPHQEMTSHNINRCPLGWMVDPLSNSCQEVVCSFPNNLNILDMSCEERFESVTFGSVEIPFKFELDSSAIFKLRDLPQFHEYLIQALEPFRRNTLCNYQSIFYKTDSKYDSLTNENYNSGADDDIVSGIVIFYTSLRETGFNSYESVRTYYLTSNITVAGGAIELEYDRTETSYLPTATNSALLGRTITLDGERNADIFSIYRDPFDGRAVLKVGESFDIDTCVSNNLLYKKSFYECPAFVYERSVHGINYTATGIVLSGVNVELSFGEFRSLNDTHVAICLNKLEEKGFSVQDTFGTSDCGHGVFYLFYSQIALIIVVTWTSYTDNPWF